MYCLKSFLNVKEFTLIKIIYEILTELEETFEGSDHNSPSIFP